MGVKLRQFEAFVRGLFFDASGRFALKKYGKIRIIALVSCTFVFVVLSGIITPFYRNENLAEAVSESSQPSTLTLTSVRDTATVSINPTASGTFGKSADSSSISFNITTNNYSGYTLSARTSRTTLINGSSSLSSLASSISESQFSNASNTTLNNRWGYKPNYYNSSSNSNFLPSPGTSSSTLDRTTTANSTAKNYTIVLGARVNTEVPAGTYINDTLVLEATANAVPYTIKFNKAADDDIISNMPSNQTGESVSANNVTLSNTTPTRVNYTFAGWCTTIPVASAGGYTCNGTTYAPGSDYNINFTVDNTDNNLYAIWTSTHGCNKAATTIGTGNTSTDAVCMQDINDTIITSMTEGTQHTLIDMRDGKSYFIAKQADGKVWMTQNLDYDLSTSTTLTHNNTDLGYTTSNLSKTWTPARATITGDVSGWHNDTSVVDSFDPGTKYYYSSGTLDDDTESTTCDNASTCAHYHVGNYYNWPAAVAGNIPASSDMYTKAEDSVCPAGWRLIKGPTSDYIYGEEAPLISANENISIYYYISDSKVNFTQTLATLNLTRNAPVYWARTGYIKNSAFVQTGRTAAYWSNIVNDADTSFDAWSSNVSLDLRDYTNRAIGFTVRCVARMTTGTTTVNFNGNGADSGSMASRTAPSGDAINITNEFGKEGHKFVKWNTQPNGSGIDYTGIVGTNTNGIVASPTENLTITLYAQWAEAYVIKYDGNNDTGTTTMAVTHEVADGTSITLYASNYSRAGYGFLGWSTTQIDPDGANAATQIANAKIFGPNETITANSTNLGRTYPATVTLYAVWIKSAGDMQDWQGCSSMSIGDVTARKDTRDNNVYAIAKLADGACWMIENLRLDNEHSTDPTKSQGFGGNFIGLAESELSTFLPESVLPNSLYTTDNTDTSRKLVYTTLAQEQVFYAIPRYYNSVASVKQKLTGANQNVYSYGNYYNLPAAKASTTTTEAGSSICPSGWFLPEKYSYDTYTGSGYGRLNNLVNNGATNTSANLRKYPINLIYAGYAWSATVYGRGTTGYYWADSSAGYAPAGSAMKIADDSADPSYTPYRTVGTPVRCVTPLEDVAIVYANDGSNRKQTFEKRSGGAILLGQDIFLREGYAITSWNTSADGNGTSYPVKSTFSGASQMSGITVLYAQWSPAYKITYNGNNAANTSGMSTISHPYAASDVEVTLYANNYNRPGYGFLGWSTTQINPDASNAATLIASAKIFGPTETITANSTTLGQSAPANITLYAVWLKSSGNIDSWSGCSAMTAASYSDGTITPGSVVALTDTRDNNTYAIAKLSDGNCWMIEDLRLDVTTANITASNTNNPTTGFLSERTTNHSYCTTEGSECYDVVRYQTVPYTLYSGYYYNWYTATAGNGWYSHGSITTKGDICPAGWQMTDEYNTLITSLGYTSPDSYYTYTNPEISDRLRTYPNNFTYTGYVTTGYVELRTGGNYWTTKAYTHTNAKYLAFTDDGWYSASSASTIKVSGIKVRCLKKVIWITYDGNGADSGTTTSVEHILKTGNTITLMPSNYKRAGYGFAGWSTTQIDPDSSTAATQIANATIYGPNQTISSSDFSGDAATLYAVWVKSTGNLQNWTGCSSLAQGRVTALKDTRDNQVYAVAKLADGNCWTIENLRLDSANSIDATKAQGFGGVFTGLASTEIVSFYDNTLANSLYTTDTTSPSLNIISGNNLNYRIPRYNNSNTNQAVENMTLGAQNIYSYGNYYNWAAAIANTNDIGQDNGADRGTSICPAGWRLPTGGGSNGEFMTLQSSVNGLSNESAQIRRFPNNFILSGYTNNSGFNGRGTTGYYWSRNSNQNNGAYRLELTTSVVTENLTYKYLGASVRCIKANGVEITLDSNDGTDRVARLYGTAGDTITIPDEAFIYNGYKITSWNTADDGTGTSYTTSITVPSSNTRLYAQWANSYTIRYNGNSPTSDTNMNAMAHLNVVTGDEITLYSNNYGRTGYGFLGWSITQINPDASNAATLIANAKIFGPNETITVSPTTMGQDVSDGGTEVTLYAVWLKSSGYIQEWNSCGQMTAATYNSNGTITPGDVIALTDSRDGNVYAIAKLADGRCWMIENLRLDPKTADITTENTNNPTSSFLARKSQTFDTCYTNDSNCIERVLYKDNNPESQYSGTYYNWYTATAGNGLTETESVIGAGDICPAGWHIPSGDTSSGREFGSLNVSVGGTRANLDDTTTPTGNTISRRVRTYPYNFQYNGMYSGNQVLSENRDSGYLWAANGWTSATPNYFAHYHGITDVLARLSYGYQKQNNIQVRCIKDTAKVNYNGNGADSGTSMAVTHTATPSATITLYPSNYKRAGYGFLGWSLTRIDPDAVDFATQLANATIYGPNETITLPSTLGDTTTFYAVWIKSAGDMQGWSGCSSLSSGDVTALKDTRDNQVYAVAKLADGNCWMIENLRLNNDYDNMDWGDKNKSQGFGGNFNGLANSEMATFAATTLANSIYTTDVTSNSPYLVSGESVEYHVPRYNNSNTTDTVAVMTGTGQNIYSYGNYYNFNAANASTESLDTTTESDNAGTSICPAGWRLPTGLTDGESTSLNTAINSGSTSSSTGWRTYPNNFIYSGNINTGAFGGRGSSGYYWSGSAKSAAGAYTFYFSGSSVTLASHVYRRAGYSVRCIVASGIEIKLDANDGSGKFSRVYGTSGASINLPQHVFIKNGYAFKNWNTAANGSGTTYTTTYTISSPTTLYAQWDNAYTIKYHGNGATSTSTMNSMIHIGVKNGQTITPYPNNIGRTGYGFLGWSFTQIDPDDPDFDSILNSTKVYGPSEIITINSTVIGQSAPATAYLYAVWVKSAGNLQGWDGCGSLTAATYSNGAITAGGVTALTDTRDGNTYAVAKLTDNQCWIIENLRLDPKTANITADNTNHPTEGFLTNRTTSYSWCNTSSAACAERVLYQTRSFSQYAGNYYNWYTVTAGNGLYASNDGTGGDICPTGWHLPTGGTSSSSDYANLSYSMGGNRTTMTSATNPTGAVVQARLRSFPINFVVAGYTYRSDLFDNMSWSYNWSSQGYLNNSVYYGRFLGFDTANVRLSYGNVKYYALTARCIKGGGSISYNGNGASNSTAMADATQTNITPSSDVMLQPSNYQRAGYGFLGWSTTQIDPDASNFSTLLSNATVYGPNETINTTGFSDSTTLYAVWIKSAGNLQNWTGCSSMSSGDVTALKDTRDNQVYAVAKLADGRCWMIENLRLDSANSTDSTKAQGFGGAFSGLANSELANISMATTTANSIYTTDNTSNSLVVIRGSNLGYRMPRYNNTNTANAVSSMSSKAENIYSYGHYYNHAAAAANTSNISSATGDRLGSSICPAGWRLPTGGSSTSEFGLLNASANSGSTTSSADLRSYPNNLLYAGVIGSGSINLRGSGGYYWSSTASSATTAYRLAIANSYTSHQLSARDGAIPVRCILATGVEIKLDANDGSDRVARLYGASGETISLPFNESFYNENYKISSWNTNAAGTGTSYTDTYTISTATTLYAQWDIETYTIIYNGNNADSAYNMNTVSHSDILEGNNVMLKAANFHRSGYGFLGWSTTQINPDASNAETLIANAKIFGPNETITANSATLGQSAPATITLYAVWLKSSGIMQDWTTASCTNMTAASYSDGTITPGSVVALRDYRDNEVYTIAKLADGSCWMIENLRLDPAVASISASNTNNPTSTFISNRLNTYSWCSTSDADCVERVLSVENPIGVDAGRLYNWYTATAGNGTLETGDASAGDICPTGWHLPTANYSSDYSALSVSVGGKNSNLDSTTTPSGATISARLRTYPYNFIYTGYRLFTTQYETTTNGYYHASEGHETDGEYYKHFFNVGNSEVEISYGRKAYVGNAIRCVKDAQTATYNGNGATGSTTMSYSHKIKPGQSITLATPNYSRSGYGFLGWSTTQLNPDASNFATLLATEVANGNIYGPNQRIIINSASDMVFYAVWIKSAGNMQGWNGCSSMSIGDVTALKDTRDNQVYAVAKLTNDTCWMIENLRLNNANSTDSTKAQGFGGYFTGLANPETTGFDVSFITPNSLYTSDQTSTTLNIISGDNISYRFPRYNNQNTANTVSSMTALNQNIYGYGNYYTFAAAKATTITSPPDSGSSICPAGWMIPTIDNSDDLKGALENSVASRIPDYTTGDVAAELRAYPNNFVFAGSYYGSSAFARGSAINVWLDTLSGSTGSKIIYAGTSSIVDTGYNWSYGLPVRCVAASGFEIKLDANDGSDRVMRLYGDSNDVIIMPSETFYRKDYVISSFNTSSDGTGTNYTTTYPVSSATTLYAQWTSTYTITYDGNGATGSTTMPIRNDNVYQDSTIMLYAPNYSRSGYGFAGWSLTQIDPDASNASTLIANATIYGPNEVITANATTLGQSLNDGSKTITFYAVWVKSAGNMQDWTGCTSMTTGEITARRDTRDGNVYAIAKLADGRCWMIENLRLSDNSSSPNWGDATSSQGFGGVFNGLAASENIVINDSIDNSLYSTSATSPVLYHIFANSSSAYGQIPRYNATSSSAVSAMTDGSQSVYSYGNYYTFAAANATTVNYTTSSGTDGLLAAGTSICPSGWILPSSSISSALGTAIKTGSTVSGADYARFPNNFVASGYMSGSAYGNRGKAGQYWLQDISTLDGRGRLLNVFPMGNYAYITSSGSVRCLAATGVPITLEANDNSGRVARIYGTAGSAITLPTRNFEQTGKTIESWNTNASGTGTNYTTTYTIPSGSTGVTLYAKWVPSYTIVYDGNGATGSGTMSANHEGIIGGMKVTLNSSNYSRSGYGFAGWSFTQINPDASNFATLLASATVYGPNETITAPSRTGDTMSLYAVWVKSAGNIQNWTGCSSLATGGITALTDLRDNQVYAISKLEDGKCWMIENLRLSDNTDNPDWGDPTLSQGFGGVFHGLASSESVYFSNSTISNSLYGTTSSSTYQIVVGDYNSRTNNYAGYYIPRYNNINLTNSDMDSKDDYSYSYGNYYTVSAAIASTMRYEGTTTTTSSTYSGTSICPAGWVLPTGGTTTSDYNVLMNTINSNSAYPSSSEGMTKFPNNFVFSGNRQNSSIQEVGYEGYYWSRSSNTDTYQYFLRTRTGARPLISSGYKMHAATIRCIIPTGVPVTLQANDSSNRVSRVYGTAGSTITLPPREFSQPGYKVTSWNTNASGTGTNYTTSYTIPSGSTGVTLYAKWSPTYSITYNGNNASASITMDITHENVVAGEDVPLYAPNFLRTGYGFLGWSFTQIDPDASNATTLIKNATVYGPNEIITAPAKTADTRTLYAVWVKSSGNLQNWTGCSSMSSGDFVALSDTRDSNTYAVALLADGRCWMIENIRLNHTANITSSNTQGFGGVFSGLAASETTTFSTATTANSLYSTTNITGDNQGNRIPRYNNLNTLSPVATMTSGNQFVESYGNYYNWAAAMANTNDFTDGTSESAGTSICPKGWHLPSGGTDGTKELYNLSALNDLIAYPNNFVYAGYRYYSIMYDRGSAGYIWSRSASSSTNAYGVNVRDSGRNSSYNPGKYYGLPVRCIAGSS